MTEEKGNGHKTIEEAAEQKVFEGVTVTLGELQRQDGIIAEAIDKQAHRQLGVIQSVISAVEDDKHYRLILKYVPWKNDEQRRKAVLALQQCERTGAVQTKKAILDDLTAMCGGLDGWLLNWTKDALTHTTFTSNKKMEKKRERDGNKSNSPLSQ